MSDELDHLNMPRAALRRRRMHKPTDVVQLSLRVREALRRRLAHSAQQNNTSLNGEINNRLVASYRAEEFHHQQREEQAHHD